jgi:C4-dicarboxylate-specific signal transduction histidine kinase
LKSKKLKKLSSVIRNEYIRSIVYPLLIIELTLLIAYFWSNSFVNSATQNALIDEAKVNILEISKRSAQIIDREFHSISDTTAIFKSRHEEFFENFDLKTTPSRDPHYTITTDGVIVNSKKSEDSCTLFYSNIDKKNPSRINKAVASGGLDPFYNDLLATNENIVQLYFNAHDSMNRLCPFMENALGQYPHDINIPSYNFYYLADQKHNPNKKVVWTDAYLDPAGKGWMISAIAPVYKGEFLEGVVGIDVTLEKILDNILSIKLPYTTYAMLVDQSGNILAMSQPLEPIIGIKELTQHEYKSPITETISKPMDFNLFEKQSNPLNAHLAEMIAHQTGIKEFSNGADHYLVTQNHIDQTGWKLILLVDENSLLAKTTELKYKTDNIGYIILGLMLLFYIIFIILIVRRSRQFSQTILKPIQHLVNATEELKTNLTLVKVEYSNIQEIDILIDNFSRMGSELKSLYDEMQTKIDEGVAKNNETQKMMIYQSRLAALGEMISMIAHQWRQPINTIALLANNLYFDLELNTLKPETVKTSILKTLDLTQELSKTIDDFKNFFKPDKALDEVALDQIVDDAIAVVGKTIEYANIKLIRQNSEGIFLKTYTRELVQVIVNILKNSKDAFESKEIKNKKIIIKSFIEENIVNIVFWDNAGGIKEGIIDKIFDPYFTTKEDMNGTGLGLYISKIIIEKHLKGSLSALNIENGVCFTLMLPQLNLNGE